VIKNRDGVWEMSFQLIGCKQQNRHKKEKKIELTAMTEE
jgi:hypothetical protein